MGSVSARRDQTDLTFVSELLEAGKVKPVIDRCYLLGVQSQSEMGRIG